MTLDLVIKNNDGETSFKNIDYTYKNKKLIFNTPENNYKFIIDKSIQMNKENNESKIEMLFINDKESNGIYTIKELNTIFNLNIETNNLEITDKSVIIDYELSIEEENAGVFRIEIYFN